ncbi:MAG: hypothetical protein JOZ99_06720 [Actinobacteria bacterium]|nr:hypothetical protein [Actinomycetota bacterium]
MTLAFLHPQRRRRYTPSVPPSWQTSQSVAADLHRRLHRALGHTRRMLDEARRCGVATGRYELLCDELDDTAEAVDDQLVRAAELPVGVRHRVLLQLRYQIADVERTASRVGRTALEAASPVLPSVERSLRAINERLDVTVEARAEARQLGT